MVIKGDISDDFKVIYLGLLQTKCDFFSSAATVDLQLAQSLARSLYDNWAYFLLSSLSSTVHDKEEYHSTTIAWLSETWPFQQLLL